MAITIQSAALSGVDAFPVGVEVQISNGLSSFTIIGLGDSAVRESRDRIRCALRNCGLPVPDNILVSLAPAEIRKEGSAFDLAMALGILAAQGIVDPQKIKEISFHGELALNGELRPIKGVLALAITALQNGCSEIVVPIQNLEEARLISGLVVTGVANLIDLLSYLRDGLLLPQSAHSALPKKLIERKDLGDVWGQDFAKRAMIVAAAGGHNLMMIGPPGCGKSMLAERFPALLPPLTDNEMLEVVKVHSVAGLPVQGLLRGNRPFRNPHYIISDAGLVGGGTMPRPGEVTLAHCGVLFLDEFPEYRRSAIEALRTPMETGRITVARARGSIQFPARFQLIAAMNPCPCGKLGSKEMKIKPCECSRGAIQNYLKKLSQPILDRIDLHVELNPVPVAAMTSFSSSALNSTNASEQITSAQTRQRDRNGGKLNAELGTDELKSITRFKGHALDLLVKAAEQIGLSARGYMRVVKVAQTVADLASQSEISEAHVAEAVGYRSLERLEKFIKGQ